MQTPIDFYGLNIYNRVVVSGGKDDREEKRNCSREEMSRRQREDTIRRWSTM